MSNSLDRRRSSSSFLNPTTPKRYHNSDSTNSATDVARHRRVEDESDIEKQYVIGDILGTGAFGVVKEITNRLTQQKFAMKIVNKDKPGSHSIQLLEREVEVLKRVNHPHIIQLEEVFETAKKMYLIMELCKGGELSDELRRKTYFREEETKVIMGRLTEAVVYMHDNDMVHRDLKLENILLSTADSSDNFNIKVTDFGLAHMKGLPGCDDLMHMRCGTLYYMAPEVFNGHDYTKMCDVWSLGVIMYILLCGRVPFKGETSAKLEEVIVQGQLTFQEIEWINVSQVAKDLVKSMLCVDTSERCTARKVLDDPWFTGKKERKVKNALDLMRTLDSESAAVYRELAALEEVSTSAESDKVKSESCEHNRKELASPSSKMLKPPPATSSGSSKRRSNSVSVVVSPRGSKHSLRNSSTSSIHLPIHERGSPSSGGQSGSLSKPRDRAGTSSSRSSGSSPNKRPTSGTTHRHSSVSKT